MQQPTLLKNIATAMLLTGLSFLAGIIFHQYVSWQTADKLTTTLTAVCYLGYWFYNSRIRPGKITAAASTVLLALSSGMLMDSLNTHLLIIVGLIWINRIFLYYSISIAASADLVLCLFSLACAYWAFFTSGSLVLATWSFLLLQSLQAMIPNKIDNEQGQGNVHTDDGFNHAFQTAQMALRLIAKKM